MKFLVLISVVLLVAACSGGGGKELAVVKDSDPTWALVPDRVELADLPR